jgi:glycosyltransferase involved in cell wall biosynthesis
MTDRRIAVSVILITYNHELYVRQAIESVLMQETAFGVEVIISDDCSTDGTPAILGDYESRYPDRIRVLRSSRNLCTNEVLMRAWDLARGEYVALLDGDDFWTHPAKLHRQASLLDMDRGFSGCCHNVRVEHVDRGSPPDCYNPTGGAEVVTIQDLLRGNVVATCSVMYRKSLVPILPEWYRTARYGDWPLHLLFADRGPLRYLEQEMATYRIHSSGYWSRMSEELQLVDVGEFLAEMEPHFGAEHGRALYASRTAVAWRVANGHLRAGRLAAAATQILRVTSFALFGGNVNFRHRLSLLARAARRRR